MTERQRKYFRRYDLGVIVSNASRHFVPASDARSVMIDRGTVAFRTLLTIARQRKGLDEPRCRLVLEFLSTAHSVQSALHRDLARLNLSEAKLGVLVVLFALDPSPATPAQLAGDTGTTRSAITDVLDYLEAHHFVVRHRDTQDRRLIYIHLTDLGRQTADQALTRYLAMASQLANGVDAAAQPQLLTLCTLLNTGSAHASSATPQNLIP